jgi:hypothetical protein
MTLLAVGLRVTTLSAQLNCAYMEAIGHEPSAQQARFRLKYLCLATAACEECLTSRQEPMTDCGMALDRQTLDAL